jgi:hypothetical protein
MRNASRKTHKNRNYFDMSHYSISTGAIPLKIGDWGIEGLLRRPSIPQFFFLPSRFWEGPGVGLSNSQETVEPHRKFIPA